MKKLSFYVLKELIGPFFLSLTIILFILIVNFLIGNVERILGKGIPLQVVFEFIILNMAWILALVVPMSVLVATLIAFGRLSADNEIIAVKSSGANLYKLTILPLFFAGLLCAGLIHFNDKVVPEANFRASMLKRDIIQKKPTLFIEEGVFVDEISKHKFFIKHKNPNPNSPKIQDIFIYDFSSSNSFVTITAKEGEISISPDGNLMLLNLYNGEFSEIDKRNYEKYTRINFEKQVFALDAELGFTRNDDASQRGKRDVEQNLEELHKTIANDTEILENTKKEVSLLVENIFAFHFQETKEEQTFLQNDSLAQFKFLKNKTVKDLNKLSYLKRKLESKEEEIKQNLVEVYKKYSIPAACIVFVLLGIPLGMIFRRSGISVGGSISMFFFLIYYGFLIQGEALADEGLISPFWGMWSANVILGTLGIILLYVVVEEKRIKIFR